MDKSAGSSATSSRPGSGNPKNSKIITEIDDDDWINSIKRQLDSLDAKIAETASTSSSKSQNTSKSENSKTQENEKTQSQYSRQNSSKSVATETEPDQASHGRYKIRPPDHPFLENLSKHRQKIQLSDFSEYNDFSPFTETNSNFSAPTDNFLPPIPKSNAINSIRRIHRPFQHTTFPIYVETLTGTVFEVVCSTFETVHSIKDKIYRLEGIPISRQHLIFRQKELKQNEELISNTGIVPESKLMLILDVKGGPINAPVLRKPDMRNVYTDSSYQYDIVPVLEQNGSDSEENGSDSQEFGENSENLPDGKPDMVFHTYHNGNSVLIVSYSDQNLPPPISPTDIYDRSKLKSREHFSKTAANLIDDSKMNLKIRNLRQKMLEKKLEREQKRKAAKLEVESRENRILLDRNDQNMRSEQNLRNHQNMQKLQNLQPSKYKPQTPGSEFSSSKFGSKFGFSNSGLPNSSFSNFSNSNFTPSPPPFPPKPPNLLPKPPNYPITRDLTNNPQKSNSHHHLPPISTSSTTRVKLPSLPTPHSIKHNHDNFLKKYNLTSPREISSPPPMKPPIFNLSNERIRLIEQLNAGKPSSTRINIDSELPLNQSYQNHPHLPKPPSKPKKKSHRKVKCSVCQKKIPTGMEFTCRCDLLLCAFHRTAEAHECNFDYKRIGRQELKKDNPLVTASKLTKLE